MAFGCARGKLLNLGFATSASDSIASHSRRNHVLTALTPDVFHSRSRSLFGVRFVRLRGGAVKLLPPPSRPGSKHSCVQRCSHGSRSATGAPADLAIVRDEKEMPPAVDGGEKFAAVDCGSNCTRLLVCSVAESGRLCDVIARVTKFTRLGEGLGDGGGEISANALRRNVGVLQDYRTLLEQQGVIADGRVRAVATSAARRASNRDAFLEAADRALGVRPDVISGVEEARLSFLGAVSGLNPDDGPFLAIDVGGGSTELAFGPGPGSGEASGEGLEAVTSVEIGTVRLTERFLSGNPPSEDALSACHVAAIEAFQKALEKQPLLKRARTIVGVGGTATCLAAMGMKMAVYDRHRVHLSELTRGIVQGVLGDVKCIPSAMRLALPGLEKGREDVIVAGCIIVMSLMDALGRDTWLASDSDILDGIVLNLFHKSRGHS